MTTTIITKDGDMLDALCKAHYGREGLVLAVLEANPQLGRLPAVLPAGVVIVLPEVESTPEAPAPEIRLWD